MSDSGTTTAGATPPPDPFDEMWYVQGTAQAPTLHRGHEIKAMLERGSIGARTWVAKVGAPQWSQLADVPAFAGLGVLRNTVHYAGFWMRVLAYLVDSIAISFVTYPMLFLFALAAGQPASDGFLNPNPLANIANFVFVIGYYVISVSSRWQATPGKRLCGIYVIREDGRKIGYGLAVGRYFAAILSALILGIGFIMVGLSNQKTGLHDLLCRTRVIYGKAEDESQIAEIFA